MYQYLANMTRDERKWIDSEREPGTCPFDYKVFRNADEDERRRYCGTMLKAPSFRHQNLD